MSDPLFLIRVGENGRRCGLAVAKKRDVELRILVLPKAWQPEKESYPVLWESQEHGMSCFSIVCWEGNSLCLEHLCLGERRKSHIAACIQKMVTKSQYRVDMEMEEQRKRQDQKDYDGDSEVAEDGLAPSALVRLAAGSVKPFKCPSSDIALASDTSFDDWWSDFYGLWYYSRSNRSDYDPRQWIRVWESLGPISGSRVTQVLLVPLLHHAFVNLIESLLRHIRPGYSRVTAATTFVRGRMDLVSAAIVANGGSTKCKCTFDSFGLDSPITQVVSAALRVVRDYSGDLQQFPDTNAKANWLAGHLQGVSLLGARQALRQGVSLRGRFTKSDGAWTSALEMACDVIDRDVGLSPSAGAFSGPFGWSRRGDEGFIFDIDTATIWQNIVEAAWPGGDDRFKYAVHPWKSSSGETGRGMKADDVRHSATEVTIIDSKYKKRPVTKPSAGDQRQMFTYAHAYPDHSELRGLPGRQVRCWLVYPEFKWDTRNSAPERRTEKLTAGNRELVCIEALFPQREDTRSQRLWNRRMREMRGGIQEVIK